MTELVFVHLELARDCIDDQRVRSALAADLMGCCDNPEATIDTMIEEVDRMGSARNLSRLSMEATSDGLLVIEHRLVENGRLEATETLLVDCGYPYNLRTDRTRNQAAKWRTFRPDQGETTIDLDDNGEAVVCLRDVERAIQQGSTVDEVHTDMRVLLSGLMPERKLNSYASMD